MERGLRGRTDDEREKGVYTLNVAMRARGNRDLIEAVWTGKHLQMTLASVPRHGEIGVEIHEDTDQYIRVEYGSALAMTGGDANSLNNKFNLRAGDAIIIPAGVWHNVVNTGRYDLKLSSVYAPPHHGAKNDEK